MTRLGAIFFVWAILPITWGFAQDSSSVKSVVMLRVVPNEAFSVGERLVFDVSYSFITAGEAVFEIARIDTVNGRPSYRILFSVNSTPSFSWIYRVEDRYETVVDMQGLFPWRFSQRIREGKYARDFQAEFDQINHVARTTEGIFPIPPYVQDVVSAFYYTRTVDFSGFAVGQKFAMQNFYKDSTYILNVKFLGRQQIKVKVGTFNCIIVEPMIREGGLFKSEGRVLIWLTDDERKIPVKVSTQIVVGSIEAELREYSGIVGPIRARVK
ncbi:MAG TPA: DUF3108 domain-containing protein [Bacteroidota bacterium]|nr:DUF3108 domain-containing protein [Bacteroidota bacterium]